MGWIEWRTQEHMPSLLIRGFCGIAFISKNLSVRKKRRLSSRSGRVGWAAHVFDDRTGPLERTGLEATYAYHLNLGEGQLSFGLSGVFYQFRLNKDKVITD